MIETINSFMISLLIGLASLFGFSVPVEEPIENLGLSNLRTITVRQGGHGTGDIASSTLYVSGFASTTAFVATSSPTFNYITATSTTASSTFYGGLHITADGNLGLSYIGSCTEALETDADGNVFCGTDNIGVNGDPNVILTVAGGTTYLQASTTGNAWLFTDGFVSQGASSTVRDLIVDTSILAHGGVLTLGGTAATNNENLTYDFETTANQVGIGSGTGVTRLRFADNLRLDFGDGNDMRIRWITTIGSHDYAQISTRVGAGAGSGYITILESADFSDVDRAPLTTTPDPTLRIYSSDAAQALDYLELYHNQTDAVLAWGNGSLLFGNGIATTTIDSVGLLTVVGGLISSASSTIETLTVQDGLYASSTLMVNGLTFLTGGLTIETGDTFTFNGDAFTSFTSDGTLSIVSNALRVVDVTCTDCLNATEIEDIYLLDDGDTATGAYDFSGATFIMPTGASPTVNAVGEFALDTTSNNLILATSTDATEVVLASATTSLYRFAVASTSARLLAGEFQVLPSDALPQVVTGVICYVIGGTSQVFNLSDTGTNDTNSITCTTTITQYEFTANTTFTAYEAIRVEWGTRTSETDEVIINLFGYRQTD